MARRVVVDLFCEDSGHELFARALVRRLAAELGMREPEVRARSVRGGHGQAVTQLRAWLRWDERASTDHGDLLLVMVDANSDGWAARRRVLEEVVDPPRYPAIALACPDPHVEAWCAADPETLNALLGVALPPRPPAGKGRYKRWLRAALEAAGQVVLGDPMDISADLVPAMDLYRAGKNCPSLGHAIGEVRDALARAHFAARS